MVKTRYVRTNKRKVFKQYYLLASVLSVFSIFSALGITYKDKDLNRTKWRGTLLGSIQLPGLYTLWFFAAGKLLDMSFGVAGVGFMMLLFIYAACLIAFALKYRTE